MWRWREKAYLRASLGKFAFGGELGEKARKARAKTHLRARVAYTLARQRVAQRIHKYALSRLSSIPPAFRQFLASPLFCPVAALRPSAFVCYVHLHLLLCPYVSFCVRSRRLCCSAPLCAYPRLGVLYLHCPALLCVPLSSLLLLLCRPPPILSLLALPCHHGYGGRGERRADKGCALRMAERMQEHRRGQSETHCAPHCARAWNALRASWYCAFRNAAGAKRVHGLPPRRTRACVAACCVSRHGETDEVRLTLLECTSMDSVEGFHVRSRASPLASVSGARSQARSIDALCKRAAAKGARPYITYIAHQLTHCFDARLPHFPHHGGSGHPGGAH